MPEVSVVIPSYNHAAYIRRAIESVLAQTHADFELIVVDDGSSDNSLQVIHEFNDPRMRVIDQENQGAHAAINRGIELAQGRYVAILNSDDAYTPDRLEKMLALLKADSSAGLAGSYIQVIDHEGKRLGVKHAFKDLEPWPLAHPELSFRAGDDPFAALLTENHLATTSNFFFERSWHARVGGFRPLRYTHDWDFALGVTRAAGGKLCIAPEPLLEYRIHPHNTIRENKAAMIYEICWVLAVHLPGGLQMILPRMGGTDGQAKRWLYSVYTYQADKVLALLLSMNLATNETLALELLSTGSPLRQDCLEYIQSVQTEQPEPPQATPGARLWRRLRNFYGRLTTKIQ